MNDNALGLLGLMRRAGAIEPGEDHSADAIGSGKAKLLLLSADVSDKARLRAERFTYGHRVQTVPLPYTNAELAKSLGIGSCSMAAVTDIGFANALMKELCRQYPEQYESVQQETEKRCTKARRRQQETLAQRTDTRKNKRRTEA